MDEVPALPDDVLELGSLIRSPVFVIGCARSGTSIFGEALASHPSVAYLFEASAIWSAAVPDRDDHRLSAADATPEVARALYPALAAAWIAAGASDDSVRLEKNPKHVLRVAFLDRLFPTARFLHIIRDGRDVVASLMFRNRGPRWGHLEIPGWRELLAKYADAAQVRCAHQWRYAVECARREGSALGKDRYHELRYEDLVATPRDSVERALGFVGLDLAPETEDFIAKIQDRTAGSYHARKQLRHFVDNHERRVGRHRENLDATQIAEVDAVCGELLGELGYR